MRFFLYPIGQLHTSCGGIKTVGQGRAGSAAVAEPSRSGRDEHNHSGFYSALRLVEDDTAALHPSSPNNQNLVLTAQDLRCQ
jgi:hypothetical protein